MIHQLASANLFSPSVQCTSFLFLCFLASLQKEHNTERSARHPLFFVWAVDAASSILRQARMLVGGSCGQRDVTGELVTADGRQHRGGGDANCSAASGGVGMYCACAGVHCTEEMRARASWTTQLPSHLEQHQAESRCNGRRSTSRPAQGSVEPGRHRIQRCSGAGSHCGRRGRRSSERDVCTWEEERCGCRDPTVVDAAEIKGLRGGRGAAPQRVGRVTGRSGCMWCWDLGRPPTRWLLGWGTRRRRW